jgi:hypothetical protein
MAMMDPRTMNAAEMMQDNLDLADDLDTLRQDNAFEMAPEGEYSKKALNQLISSLNKARELFDAAPISNVTEDLTVMTEDMVLTLMMLKQASADAGTELPVNFQGASDDRDLAVLTAQVDGLVGDRMFKKFLNTESGAQPSELEQQQTETAEEVVAEDDQMADVDMDALMMERL